MNVLTIEKKIYETLGLITSEEYNPVTTHLADAGKNLKPDISTLNIEQAIGFQKMVSFCEGNLCNEEGEEIDMLVVQGIAGTGKSYLNSRFLEYMMYKKSNQYSVAILTPTHQASNAAKKLSLHKNITYATIHAIAGVRKINNPQTGKEEYKPIQDPKFNEFDLIIIDEAGMVNKELANLVIRHCKNVKIIWTGDPRQLPPVGETESFVYQMEGGTDYKVERIRLLEPMRAALEHPITQIANQIRLKPIRLNKIASNITDEGFRVIMPVPQDRENGSDLTLDTLLEKIFSSSFYKEDNSYCAILAWSNKNVGMWNRRVRRILWRAKYGVTAGAVPVLFEREYVKLSSAYIEKQEDSQGLVVDVPVFNNNDVLRVISYDPHIFIIPGIDKELSILKAKVEKQNAMGAWVEYPRAVELILSDKIEQYESLLRLFWDYVNNENPSLISTYWEVRNYGPILARYAYASTVHKRQGCTDVLNIIDAKNISASLYYPKDTPEAVRKDHYQRMLYTASTRAKKGVYYLV